MRSSRSKGLTGLIALASAAVLAACAPQGLGGPTSGSIPGLGGSLAENPAETPGLTIGIVPTTAPPLKIGEAITFSVRSSQGGFASLYLISTSGVTTTLTENLILGVGSPAVFPVENSGVQLVAQPPAGPSRVLLLVTSAPFNGVSDTGPVIVPTATGLGPDQLIDRINTRTAELPYPGWETAETIVKVTP